MSWQQPGCSVASMARKNPTCAPSQESSSNKKDVILKNVSCQMVKVASSSNGAHTIWPVTSPTHVDEGLLGRGLCLLDVASAEINVVWLFGAQQGFHGLEANASVGAYM